MSDMAANDNLDRYSRTFVSAESIDLDLDEQESTAPLADAAHGTAFQANEAPAAGAGADSSSYINKGDAYGQPVYQDPGDEIFQSTNHRRRGYGPPDDDVWMDMSWATMAPERLRSNPIWSPSAGADTASERYSATWHPYANQRHNTTEYPYRLDSRTSGGDEADEFRRRPRNLGIGRQDGRRRGAGIILILAVVGLLAAAVIFGQMRNKSAAETYIETHMYP